MSEDESQDILLRTRKIILVGAIDEASYRQFSEDMRALEDDNPDGTISIDLSSTGGSAYDALAYCGRMRTSDCHIIVRAYGFVASAAVLVLAAGDKRVMTTEAWVMVHEDSDELSGEVRELERETKHMRRLEEQWASLLADRTRITADEWARMHKETTYLSATECFRLGLVDELV